MPNFINSLGGNQFFQGTLPHIVRTLEQLVSNVGRLCVAVETLTQTMNNQEESNNMSDQNTTTEQGDHLDEVGSFREEALCRGSTIVGDLPYLTYLVKTYGDVPMSFVIVREQERLKIEARIPETNE